MTSPMTPFDRSGLAALSDLQSAEWSTLFARLEQEQIEFLTAHAPFCSPEYRWPRDALHWWSRIWEYPYAYHHLCAWRASQPAEVCPLVVDVGSGVTFFPFSVARLGCQVVCTDINPVCGVELHRAIPHIDAGKGQVQFRQTDGLHLPLTDGAADAIYCISVLEHIESFEHNIAEFSRVLKPGGLLLLTIDLDLQGNSQIGVVRHLDLGRRLQAGFEYGCPDITIHPADLLTCTRGPFPLCRERTGARLACFLLKQEWRKRVLRRKPRPVRPYLLCVQGLVLRKRRCRSQ
ncbi:MAG: class I SAM-dependent methyltransferase [Planctomycetes bacterium]|nr:class I SAM-dependent methyltransferase [Planctomycetota bacterium]